MTLSELDNQGRMDIEHMEVCVTHPHVSNICSHSMSAFSIFVSFWLFLPFMMDIMNWCLQMNHNGGL